MTKKIKQYVGEKEVKSIEGTKVIFVDDTEKVFTERQMEYIVTEEPKDLTAQRDLMILNIAPDILEIIEKHDVKKVDLGTIYQAVNDSYNMLFFMAMGKAFGTYEEGVHPQYFEENIKVSDLKRLTK